jgi:hypothetical protein
LLLLSAVLLNGRSCAEVCGVRLRSEATGRSSEKTSSKKKEELVTMRCVHTVLSLSLSLSLSLYADLSSVSAHSVKKPKSLEEVWQGAAVLISDALRKLDEGITRPRFMATYS